MSHAGAAPKTASEFDREYLDVHVRKEDLYWTTYMGTNDKPAAFEEAEGAYKAYVSDPRRIDEVREALRALEASGGRGPEADEERKNLEGWLRFFGAHAIESAEARRMQDELISLESRMQQARAARELRYRDAEGNEHRGSTNVLATNLSANPDEVARKSSHDALLDLERWVLEHGFLELVRRRNAFARALGFPDFFAYRVRKNEDMSVEELFTVLDEFEALTRERCFGEIARLSRQKGEESALAHNVRYATRGDAERAMDPYLPFEKALRVWAESFHRLGIRYRGATLTLDLLERAGKYENGFMHGPQPCYLRQGVWQPARLNFTSNATPNQVGSGRGGLETLLHEGGHAAHFANVLQGSPCFAHEYPPTSMALAEMQSMFCDALLGDGDWLARYAKDRAGRSAPAEVIRALVVAKHPFMAFAERSILVVPVFERRLYALESDELTPERVLSLARACEQEILGMSPAPRPLLTLPHLVSMESACSYQGYLLAHMAVYQARAFFLERDGFIADNGRVGPELAERCWAPGNSVSHAEAVRRLVGEGPSGRELADVCNQSTDDFWAGHARRMAASAHRPAPSESSPYELDAHLRIVHGAETIATNERGMEQLFDDFEAYIARNYPR
jgi:oligoendopeptidase F